MWSWGGRKSQARILISCPILSMVAGRSTSPASVLVLITAVVRGDLYPYWHPVPLALRLVRFLVVFSLSFSLSCAALIQSCLRSTAGMSHVCCYFAFRNSFHLVWQRFFFACLLAFAHFVQPLNSRMRSATASTTFNEAMGC